jgi:large subunit ribosomal protein L15
MDLSRLHPAPGATRPRKRVGRGPGSGQGKTAGRGHKGRLSRSGGNSPPGYEGGQMPLQRRVPKRGFKNPGRVSYQVVNVGRLAEVTPQTVVDRAWLEARGLVRRRGPVKLLGGGTLKVALTVRVDAASESAKKAIEAAGGTVETQQVKA